MHGTKMVPPFLSCFGLLVSQETRRLSAVPEYFHYTLLSAGAAAPADFLFVPALLAATYRRSRRWEHQEATENEDNKMKRKPTKKKRTTVAKGKGLGFSDTVIPPHSGDTISKSRQLQSPWQQVPGM